MNLDQCKLTKSEWESIEIPVSQNEIDILKMIKNGYHNVNLHFNDTKSLIGYLKVNSNLSINYHLFNHYLLPELKKIFKKYKIENKLNELIDLITDNKKKKQKIPPINKADKFRLNNLEDTFRNVKDNIFEFILLDELNKFYYYVSSKSNKTSNKYLIHYYVLKRLINYNVLYVNDFFINIVKNILDEYNENITAKNIIRLSKDIFEKNYKITKYADQSLYSHQKKIFTIIKQSGCKLILYTAPTGTGKTITPIGLSEGKKVIFVCAARHVGLALARSALSIGKKIAFAFGCSSPDDVKLHFSAAKIYTKDWKSGGIRKVDNSVGDKVEIIISDIRSYPSAMNYMMAFTEDLNDIVMYWDEPTISLDYSEHPLHELISKTWNENIIPNIVLSSATLPNENDLNDMLTNLKLNNNFKIYSITSQDTKKTIPLLNSNNEIEMPHYIFNTKEEFTKISNHCLTHNSIMRYLDIGEASIFILLCLRFPDWINLKKNRLDRDFDNYFPDIESITLQSIKEFYCYLLSNINEDKLDEIKNVLSEVRTKKYDSTIHAVTYDAHTITDGPAIYLSNNVERVAKVYLKEINIRDGHMKEIMNSIYNNNIINEKIKTLQNSLEDKLKLNDCKEKKQNIDNHSLNKDEKEIINSINNLQEMIKIVSLDDIYVPNKKNHLKKYAENKIINGKPFCSDIPEGVIEEIMMIDGIDDNWKILLMMGIGVITTGLNNTYLEIMKDLADTQQLFLIIASSDYIYGTNYQFCHGYIGKDLENMSQEKCIQALGRIGRNKLQYEYSIRFRCNELIRKIFYPDVEKPEAINMNKLFIK